jgi:hypothetical protein
VTVTVRSSSAASAGGAAITVAKPPGTARNDHLYVIHFNDVSNSGTALPGFTTLSTGSGAGYYVRVSRRIVSGEEDSSFTFFQNSLAFGTVHIIAVQGADPEIDPRVSVATGAFSTTAPTPNVTPAGVPHLEIRAAVILSEGASWSAPGGYVLRGTAQSPQGFIASAAASKVRNESAASGSQSFTFTPADVTQDLGVSISVASAPAPVPDIPTYPPFTPARGEALYQYRVRRLRDGQFLGFLDLANVSFDKRINSPGTFSASIPVPNRRVADLIAEVIPRDSTVLSAGPGVIVVDILRGGDLWGEYWITSAKPSRSRRGTPSIALQGTTLDGYLSAVEIQEGLFYEQVDQIDILRELVAHMQAQQYANLGITVAAGTSGVLRDRTYEDDGGTYGQRIQELADVNNGFEFTIDVFVSGGTIARQIRWGYPTLASESVEHIFADGFNGGDVVEWADEISALRGATRWRARGGTPPSEDASVTATPLLSQVHEAEEHLQWWPRIDRTLSYNDVVVQDTLEDYAAFWAATAPGTLRVESYTVVLGASPSLHPNKIGDWCRIFLDNEWHQPHWRERRIIGMQITPVSRQSGKEEAKLIMQGLDVGGVP